MPGKLTITTAVPGDCGACVFDEIGNLYGHIVAGDSVSGLAYIIPAYKIFDDIEQRQGARPKLATTEEARKEAADEKAENQEAADEAAEYTVAAAAPVSSSLSEERNNFIIFINAVGRKFGFPFHLCNTWPGMEDLIREACLHVEVNGTHVAEGYYDRSGPNGELIPPQIWETMIEPGWVIKMHKRPMTEPSEVKKDSTTKGGLEVVAVFDPNNGGVQGVSPHLLLLLPLVP